MAPTAVKRAKKRAKKKEDGRKKSWWNKGQSGNPKGRPKLGNSLAELIRRMLEEKTSNSPNAKTNIEAILETSMRLARNGDIDHVKFLAERGFGKVSETPQTPSTTVNIYLPDNGRPDIKPASEPPASGG